MFAKLFYANISEENNELKLNVLKNKQLLFHNACPTILKMSKIYDNNLQFISFIKQLLLVESITTYPPGGDTFQEFTTNENYPPYKK